MSTDFEEEAVFAEPVDTLPVNEIRFHYMRIALFIAAAASLLALLFAFWALVDVNHNPAIGSFLFNFIALSIQCMFLLSLFYWKWFQFRPN